jgi:RimJ/RimL family protein N-acetyltransferase
VKVHFYRFDVGEPASVPPPLPPSIRLRYWNPASDGLPSKGSRRAANYFWWALAKVRGFARPGFTELRFELDEQVIHRLTVTPRWYRFPFMEPDDLQIGNIWTRPVARRRKLARTAIAQVHRHFAGRAARIWYVARADNAVSGALARSCGYRLVAIGTRTRRLGLFLFGQFVIEQLVQRSETETEAIAPDCGEESVAGRTLSVSH